MKQIKQLNKILREKGLGSYRVGRTKGNILTMVHIGNRSTGIDNYGFTLPFSSPGTISTMSAKDMIVLEGHLTGWLHRNGNQNFGLLKHLHDKSEYLFNSKGQTLKEYSDELIYTLGIPAHKITMTSSGIKYSHAPDQVVHFDKLPSHTLVPKINLYNAPVREVSAIIDQLTASIDYSLVITFAKLYKQAYNQSSQFSTSLRNALPLLTSTL